MPLTTSSPHQFEQYRPSGSTAVIPLYKAYQYISLCSVLTHSRPKPVLSRNPLHRLLQTEFPRPWRKVRVMAAQQGDGDSLIPTAACRWKKETLDLLNAKYDSKSVTPFNFGELLKVPSELQKRLAPSVESAKYSHRPDRG